jgi:molybdopterin molybdotransferase
MTDTMKEFFNVLNLDQVFEFIKEFELVSVENVELLTSIDRILAADIISDIDLPDFRRSTMDGFAVQGASTFGASEGNPAYLTIKGAVAMGDSPEIHRNTSSVPEKPPESQPGECCRKEQTVLL